MFESFSCNNSEQINLSVRNWWRTSKYTRFKEFSLDFLLTKKGKNFYSLQYEMADKSTDFEIAENPSDKIREAH